MSARGSALEAAGSRRDPDDAGLQAGRRRGGGGRDRVRRSSPVPSARPPPVRPRTRRRPRPRRFFRRRRKVPPASSGAPRASGSRGGSPASSSSPDEDSDDDEDVAFDGGLRLPARTYAAPRAPAHERQVAVGASLPAGRGASSATRWVSGRRCRWRRFCALWSGAVCTVPRSSCAPRRCSGSGAASLGRGRRASP